jgi:hypothetical protein
MRIRLDRYEIKNVSLQTRSIVYFLAGVPLILVGSFFLLIGFLILIMPDGGDLWARRSGFVLVLFLGLVPVGLGAVAIWRGIVMRGRIRNLREIATLGRTKAIMVREDVQAALGLGPQAAERVMLEALTDGILVPGEEDQRSPTVSAPAYASMGPPTPPLHSAPTMAVPSVGVGRVFGGTYQLEAPLGAGGMGEVWIARHLRTGRKYALKLLPQDSRMQPDAIRRFEREALAASALGHPNIVAVHDFNQDSGVHYMVMDLLEGETLEARLMRVGSLPWEDAKRIGLELASALSAAHDAGLLHRDVKPANVLLARSKEGPERAVLLDFGLVKPLDDVAVSRITVAGSAMGTPMYMSPEQARGEALDARSDLYALGAVLFEVLTGAPPFFDRTLAGVYARLLNELPPAASSVSSQRCPPAFDALLAATLAKSPSARPPDARAFAAALAQVEDGAPVTQRIA